MAKYGPEQFLCKCGKVLTIRHCEARDIQTFLRFFPQIASETTHTLQVDGKVPNASSLEKAWTAAIDDPINLFLGVFDGDTAVGELAFFRAGHRPHPWLDHVGSFGMMILRSHWGFGIGRRLLEIMDAHARQVGVSRIEAFVRTQNERGIRLYKQSGFVIEGTRRKAALIDGEYQDEFYIAKLLDESSSWKPPVIETERMILRPIGIDDAADIFAYARNPNVSRFTIFEPHQTIEDSKQFIFDYILSCYRRQIPEPYGITIKANGNKVVGTVGCYWISKPAKSMELAYAIGEPHWGQGLVAEASRAVMEYCFRDLGAFRIQSRCKVENKASARVMEKVGMKFEGTLRSTVFHRNRYWDLHYYSVLRDEWNEFTP